MKCLLLINILFVIFATLLCDIPSLRKCANPECSQPISKAKTLVRYSGSDRTKVSFPANVEAIVWSKSVAPDNKLWEVEINGKRGYAPQEFLRELKILAKDLVEVQSQVIDKEPITQNQSGSGESISEAPKIQSDPVQGSYEVIDGTRIYLNDPSTTDSYEENSSTFSTSSEVSVTDSTETSTVQLVQESLETTTASVLNNDPVLPNYFDTITENPIPISAESDSEAGSDTNPVSSESSSTVVNDLSASSLENDDKSRNSVEVEEITLDLVPKFESVETISSESIEVGGNTIPHVQDVGQNEKIEEIVPEIVAEKVSNEQNSSEKLEVLEILESLEIVNTNSQEINESSENASSEVVNSIESVNEDESELVKNESPEISLEKVTFDSSEDRLEDYKVVAAQNPIEIDNKNDKVDPNQVDTEKSQVVDEKDENIPNLLNLSSENSAENVISSTENSKTSAETETDNKDVKLDTIQVVAEETQTINENILNLSSENSAENTENVISSTSTESSKISAETQNRPESLNFVDELISRDASKIPVANTENQSENSREIPVTSAEFTDETVSDPRELIDADQKSSSAEILNSQRLENVEPSISQEKTANSSSYSYENTREPTIGNIHNENKPENYPNNQNSNENMSKKLDRDHVGHSSVEEVTFGERESESDPVTTENPQLVQDASEQERATKSNEELNVESSGIFGISVDFDWLTDIVYSYVNLFSLSNVAESGVERGLVKTDVDSNVCEANSLGSASWRNLSRQTYTTIFYFVVTSITIVVFLLFYYTIESFRRDRCLVGEINYLQRTLIAALADVDNTKAEMEKIQDKFHEFNDTAFDETGRILELEQQLTELAESKVALEEQNANLERELETATEAGLELNRMLSELLNSQSGSETITESVEIMQRQLNEQQRTIAELGIVIDEKDARMRTLEQQLDEKSRTLASHTSTIDELNSKYRAVSDEHASATAQIAELHTKVHEVEHERVNLSEKVRVNSEKFQKDYQHVEDTLKAKTHELELLRTRFSQIESNEITGESLTQLLDVTHLEAECKQLHASNKEWKLRHEQEVDKRKRGETQIAQMTNQLTDVSAQMGEREKLLIEAQTRLEVLSKYFEEKEAQLQKELSKQQDLWLEHQGDADLVTTRIKSMQDELLSYKQQNETLKKEIVDQEVSLKSKMSMLEQKAHENWLQYRQSERKLEESKQIASQLRNRLIHVEQNRNNAASPINLNGDTTDLPTSPLFFDPALGPPPPLPPFGLPMPFPPMEDGIPPPLLPGMPPFMPPVAPFPGDRRPAPLGRMSSPPPLDARNSTFSPPVGGRRRNRHESRDYSPQRWSPYDEDDSLYDDGELSPQRRANDDYYRRDEYNSTRAQAHDSYSHSQSPIMYDKEARGHNKPSRRGSNRENV